MNRLQNSLALRRERAPHGLQGTDAVWALGMMSGTSMDGVDGALVETDGARIRAFGPHTCIPYSERERAAIAAAKEEAALAEIPVPMSEFQRRAEEIVTAAHARVVERLTRKLPDSEHPCVIGFHGQSLLHAPDRGYTYQVGNGGVLAEATGLPVVCDLRQADVGAGGEGAPLVPVYHLALVRRSDLAGPVAVFNIGGVGNVTYVPASRCAEDLIAFDTGPGVALLDDWIREHALGTIDRDAQVSRQGCARSDIVEAWMNAPFFSRQPPKSLDRDAFDKAAIASVSAVDGAATLVAFTVAGLERAFDFFPVAPVAAILCGGGASHPGIVAGLKERLHARKVRLHTAKSVGWSADALEAQAFAYLAVRSVREKPLTFPGTTGVKRPMTGGSLVRGGSPAPR